MQVPFGAVVRTEDLNQEGGGVLGDLGDDVVPVLGGDVRTKAQLSNTPWPAT